MAVENKLQTLKINKLSKEKFSTIEPEANQLYFVSDDNTYVETAQGTENTGKILAVNNEGNLELTDDYITKEALSQEISDAFESSITEDNKGITRADLGDLDYVEKNQGTENAGKVLIVGEDGQVTTGNSVTEVNHDDTLSGTGTEEDPLSVVSPVITITTFEE